MFGRLNKDALRKRIERANIVKQTIDTKGWKEVIKPMLIKLRETEHQLAENSDNEKEIIKHCFNAASITRLLKFIENTLVDGKQALEQYKKL